jgi:hypothetical protein
MIRRNRAEGSCSSAPQPPNATAAFLAVSFLVLCFCDCGNSRDPGFRVDVSNANVRACDLMVEGVSDAATQVSFDDSVTGVMLEGFNRTAIAFTGFRDVALGEVIVFRNVDGQSVHIDSVSCYDRLGRVVADPGIRLP